MVNVPKVKFRKFLTSSDVEVLAGKDEDSNDALVFQARSEEMLLHTKAAGSPFCNIKSNKPSQKDIEETAIFCAKYSKDWKQNKKDIIIHIFYARDTKKEKGMKIGCFAVSKFKEIKVKKQDILDFEKELEEIKKL